MHDPSAPSLHCGAAGSGRGGGGSRRGGARGKGGADDPVIEAFKQDVDRALLVTNLARSVEERLHNLVELQRFAEQVRRAARRPRAPITDLPALLRRLSGAGVEFVVVGGVAATAQGASRLTQDLDVVYSRDQENLERLVDALGSAEPYLRGAPVGLPFRFDTATLREGLNFELETSFGDVDLLGELVGAGGYSDLLPHSEVFAAFGARCKFLGLAWLVRVARAAGRPRDLETIAELEALLEMRDAERDR